MEDAVRLFGVDVPSNLVRCPKTAELIERVPRVTLAMFSILEPGKRLPLHTGTYRGVLRYHLPLLASDPEKCGITVGGETRRFEEGAPLLFDDVYLHTAWNTSDQHCAAVYRFDGNLRVTLPDGHSVRGSNRMTSRGAKPINAFIGNENG